MTQLPGPFCKLARAMDEQTPPAPSPEERRAEAAELMRRAEVEQAGARGLWWGAGVAAALLLLAFGGWFLFSSDSNNDVALSTITDFNSGMVEQWPEAGTRFEAVGEQEKRWRVGPAAMTLTRGDAERGAAEVRIQDNISVELALESGVLSSNGDHSTRRWAFAAGPFRIAVVGTHFTASWLPETGQFSVQLHHGVIELTGPGVEGSRKMRPGERFDAVVDSETAHGSEGDPAHDPRATHESRQVQVLLPQMVDSARISLPLGAMTWKGAMWRKGEQGSGRRPAARNEPVSPSRSTKEENTQPRGKSTRDARLSTRTPAIQYQLEWMALAEERQYGAAWELAEQAGLENQCVTLNSGQLLELADTARYARERRAALEVLRCVRDRFPETADAATAAFLSGRLLGMNAQYDRAAEFYERYLQERPFGPLAREALGRLLETRVDADQDRAAIDAARRYLEAYPHGPHAGLAEQVLLE